MVVYTVKARFKNREGREIGRRDELWKGEAENGRDALIRAHEPLRAILDSDSRIDTIGIDIASATGERISTTEYADEITDGTAARGLLSDVQMPSAQEIKEEARRQDAHALDLVKRQMQEKLCSGKFDNTAGEARPEDAKDSIKGFFDAMGPADKTRHTYPVKDAGEVPATETFPGELQRPGASDTQEAGNVAVDLSGAGSRNPAQQVQPASAQNSQQGGTQAQAPQTAAPVAGDPFPVRPGPRGGYNHPGSLPGQPLRDPQDPAPVGVTGDPFRSGHSGPGSGGDVPAGLAPPEGLVPGVDQHHGRHGGISTRAGVPRHKLSAPAGILPGPFAGDYDQQGTVLDQIREGARKIRDAYGAPPTKLYITPAALKQLKKEMLSEAPAKSLLLPPGVAGIVDGIEIVEAHPAHFDAKPPIQFQRPRNRKS